ncbi:MAG: hypothetical protein HZC28_16175 [Spirochaetes bacterium]|nr:hypothetical protein [Spirochaetota bacterium]
MKRFVFSLEKVLTARKNIEDVKKNELGRVVGAYNREEAMREDCKRKMHQNAADLDARSVEDVLTLIQNADMFNQALKRKAELHAENMQKLTAEIREKQAVLAEARKQRRIVELLREKKFKEYRRDMKREEQRTSDDRRPMSLGRLPGAFTPHRSETETHHA